MKRIIAENVLAGIQLVYNSKANPSYSIVQVNSLLKFVRFDIKTAFETFDTEVNQALHTQPEKVMSGIDLENPPERLVTSTGKEAQLIGNTGEGTHPFVVQIKRKLYPTLVYSNRDGSSTVATSTFEPSLTTLHAAQVKKTGWINIYSSDRCSSNIYPTEKVAIVSANNAASLVKTIEITWEQ